MNFNKINELISSISKQVEDSEKLAIPLFAAKLSKIAEIHPYDQTIIAMAKVIDSMSNKQSFISKSEVKELYNNLYTRNSRFPEYFKEEMGEINSLMTPKLAVKEEAAITDTYNNFADPVLLNALAGVFDKNATVKIFSKELENKALKIVAEHLDRWNIRSSKITVDAGNEYFLVVKADYDTPKGLTSILIPLEISANNILNPEFFISNATPQDLNNVNIKNYIISHAGNKLKVKSSDVVNLLTKTIKKVSELNNVELALTRFNASKESVSEMGQITGLTVEAEVKNLEVNLPKLEESDLFSEKFATPMGIANFKFGTDKVNLGRDIIAKNLLNFGFKNPQITIIGCENSTIYYAISLNNGKTSFKVPVKLSNNKIVHPDILICNGSISAFSKEGINQLSVNNQTDYKAAAVASPQYSLKPSDLVENVRGAVSEGNYAKAEDALNILQQSGDDVAYKNAFIAYVNGLGMKKSAAECKCDLIVKSASSQHPVCGHTGLPLHKVYQDKEGNCRPAYRKGMDETYQGAFFMNAKIFG